MNWLQKIFSKKKEQPLTTMDIISLGWTFDYYQPNSFLELHHLGSYRLQRTKSEKWNILIEHCDNPLDEDSHCFTVFWGMISDISELKLIMQLIKITS